MSSDRRLAGILLVASAGYLAAAFLIGEPEGDYAAVGPRAFPVVIGVALAACAVWLALRRGAAAATARSAADRSVPAGEGASADWRAAAPAAVAFLAYIALLAPVGYLLATALFIPLEARLLGSRSWRRDLIAGLVVTATIYAVLGLLLGLRLPAGVFG
ncbi:MAG: tripartite tricarboxylate transporter TctB family protein [Acidobacteria bacterium]|nr:tripartite tricarboxylate transporter TctB family protein [Acidobacteriota bacterium]MYJ06080.1 tripartite tricarboxylate transporter TctB family protein [Acidobacteriota bacterium]